MSRWVRMPVLVLAAGSIGAVTAQEQSATINRYCVGCDNQKAKTAGLALDCGRVICPRLACQGRMKAPTMR
jgi:hypothetical protein